MGGVSALVVCVHGGVSGDHVVLCMGDVSKSGMCVPGYYGCICMCGVAHG